MRKQSVSRCFSPLDGLLDGLRLGDGLVCDPKEAAPLLAATFCWNPAGKCHYVPATALDAGHNFPHLGSLVRRPHVGDPPWLGESVRLRWIELEGTGTATGSLRDLAQGIGAPVARNSVLADRTVAVARYLLSGELELPLDVGIALLHCCKYRSHAVLSMSAGPGCPLVAPPLVQFHMVHGVDTASHPVHGSKTL